MNPQFHNSQLEQVMDFCCNTNIIQEFYNLAVFFAILHKGESMLEYPQFVKIFRPGPFIES